MSADVHPNLPNALIVGAGNIGAFYDTPDSTAILTHAHALQASGRFNLLGFVDADPLKAEAAATRWSVRAYATLAEAFNANRVDLVIIATPDATHYTLLKAVAAYPVRLVFCEKPLTQTVEQADEIIHLYERQGIGLAVNYSRQYVEAFLPVRQAIREGAWGRFLGGTGYYGKGLRHTGSHLLMQLLDWFESVECVQVFNTFQDYTATDLSVSALLRLHDGLFTLQAIPDQAYSVYEIDLLFERQRLHITDAGRTMMRFTVEPDRDFPDFPVLHGRQAITTDYVNCLTHAVCNLSDYLSGQNDLTCCGKQARAVLALCDAVERTIPIRQPYTH